MKYFTLLFRYVLNNYFSDAILKALFLMSTWVKTESLTSAVFRPWYLSITVNDNGVIVDKYV